MTTVSNPCVHCSERTASGTGRHVNRKVRAYYDLADCPDDGGKHALYCEHECGTGVLQGTNRRRLVPWLQSTEDWCPYCQAGAA